MRRIGFILAPGYSVMSFAVMSVFETANALSGQIAYDLHVLSEKGGVVAASVGVKILADKCASMDFDTLIVGGTASIENAPRGIIKLMQKAADRCRRVASICTGAFILAEAGLLDGRRATTHWFYARDLQARYPKIKVDEDRIFINDGPIWTSAGMTAGIDLALSMVEDDLGAEIAKSVAKKLVVYHRRAGGQSQFSALLELEPKSDRIQTALVYAKKNLHRSLSVEQLADAAGLSPRQFSRVFHSETGQSPAKAIENLRVEAARSLMENSTHTIDVVAQQTGFSDRDRMRRAFLRAFGQPPQVIRRHASLAAGV
jgi:transcriptional regulator GlxA family with amidase domain